MQGNGRYGSASMRHDFAISLYFNESLHSVKIFIVALRSSHSSTAIYQIETRLKLITDAYASAGRSPFLVRSMHELLFDSKVVHACLSWNAITQPALDANCMSARSHNHDGWHRAVKESASQPIIRLGYLRYIY